MRPLDHLKGKKIFIFNNIIIVIFLSFGISFTANALAEFFKGNPLVFFISGLFCISFVILIKMFNFYTLRKHQICTEALLVVDNKARLGKVHRYYFNTKFVDILVSICKENKAFKECWKKAFKKERTSNNKYVSNDYVPIKKNHR